MPSTYLSYNLVTRNLQQSMTRVAQQPDVARNAAYYKDNIGKVRTADDLLKNDRLYQYAMKAYGLEDMTYAKAFMRKVLESDLSNPSSFANKLADKRYREFAAAFSFNGSGALVAQTDNQTDEVIGLYTATVKRKVAAIDADTANYNAKIGGITSVDKLLSDDRLRSYVFSAFGIDERRWSRDTITQVLSSDPSDPNSYVNTVWVSRLPDLNGKIAQAELVVSDAESKIAAYKAQMKQPGADMTDLLAKVATEKDRMQVAKSSISSLNNTIAMIDGYVELAGAFEFSADGSLPSGVSAQTDANRSLTNQSFVSSKSAVRFAAENQNLEITVFRASILKVNSVKAFLSARNVYNFALEAVGLDPNTASVATIEAVLKSDPSNPKSFVYTLADDRYVQLARAFNFDEKGNLRTPLVAQDSDRVLRTATNYVSARLKSASPQVQASTRAAAQKDAEYYHDTIVNIDSVSELLANRRMVDFILVANGLDPKKVTTEYLKKIFSSDLDDPKSFANTQSDFRFAEIAASFNFGKDGKVARLAKAGPQGREQILETQHNYLQQNLEVQQGETNPGVRLALYFRRKAGEITSAYGILADKALSEVFRTAYNLPDTMASAPIDQQAKVVEKYLNLKDLADPAKVEKLLSRFSVMYDLKNGSQSSSPLLALFPGSSSGISYSTSMAIAQLRRRP